MTNKNKAKFLQKVVCIYPPKWESTTLRLQFFIVKFGKQVQLQSHVLDFTTYRYPYIPILGLDVKYIGFSVAYRRDFMCPLSHGP
jgi:hypothetical protein